MGIAGGWGDKTCRCKGTKGKKLGDDIDINGEKGILIGKQDLDVPSGVSGSKYVDNLAGDSTKAAKEFDKLNKLDDVKRGDTIRGGAKNERVSLQKEVLDDVYKKADSGRVDANRHKIYVDGKTGKDIPNHGTHYPDKTPLGHPHPKAGQKVPDSLVGKPHADVGHKQGETWAKRLEDHKKAGSTREEIIKAENDSKLYVLEERSSNRSRKLD